MCALKADDEPSRARVVLDSLRQRLGADRVLTGPEAIARYAGVFWLRSTRGVSERFPVGQPTGVVRPRDVHDISEILRQAGKAEVAVVPYGGGTAVMGSTLPIQGGIVLDLGAMNQILAIEKENRVARVQPGVILADLATAAEEKGLLFAHDPWSQPIATVGGAVETNGMGYLAAGYGSMGQQVRGLTIVLADGTIVTWPGAAKTSVGPNVRDLFIGAEGMLGVIAEVVVQLFPWPERREFLAYRFPSFADGFRAIVAMDAIGLHPSMIDYEEEAEEEGDPLEVPADMYLAFDGPDEIVRAAIRRAKQICQGNFGIARERGAANRFWETRHESAEWFIRRARGEVKEEPEAEAAPRVEWRYVDVAVPTDCVLDYCQQVTHIADRKGVGVHSFGIWARPELVSYVLEGTNQVAGANGGPLDAAMDEALTLARAEGGSIEYCHGVGVRLAHLLPIELGTGLDLLCRIKHALDPGDVLNPGKLGVE